MSARPPNATSIAPVLRPCLAAPAAGLASGTSREEPLGMAVGVTLVGRRTELDAIGRVIEAAREGRSGGVVVRGVAGVGKTALLDAAIAGAPDLRVLRAEGVQAEA